MDASVETVANAGAPAGGDGVLQQREIAARLIRRFSENRIKWYDDAKSGITLSKILKKDAVMFAARGVRTADEFVAEAFRACESSSEETVMGNTWQAIITAISSDTLDTGDMMTVREGCLYVCELKSQTNTTNSSSFPQELRELKDKCLTQGRFRRASNQPVRAAFCVLRDGKPKDEWRTFAPDARDAANADLAGFEYRYLTGSSFWRWLTDFDSPEGLIDDAAALYDARVPEARRRCLARLQDEMRGQLEAHGLGDSIDDVLRLKRARTAERG